MHYTITSSPAEGRGAGAIGLTSGEADRSRRKHGANVISKKKRKSFLSQYLASFGDPLIKILLIALGVNVVFLFKNTSWFESAGIAVALLVATLVSTLSEYGSESAFERLQAEAEHVHCRVKRSGKLALLPAAELVVGDVVFLQAGERIAADGRMLSGELQVDQAALNGESKEARKFADWDETPEQGGDLQSHSGLFTGSVVCEGEGVMKVERVGDATFYGQLAVEVQEDTIESPLKTRLEQLAKTISRMGYTAAIIVAIANLFHTFFIDSGFDRAVIIARLTDPAFSFGALVSTLTLSISVIVMAVPEGLPMMITVVLSANMRRMLKDKVLVRKLVGIETAGSLNILFTDKTGTLTRGKLSVTSFTGGDGRRYDSAAMLEKEAPALLRALTVGCLCNSDATISGDGRRASVIGGNGTDRALLQYVLPYAAGTGDIALLSHTPFHSQRKYSYSEVRWDGKTRYLIKGAPEAILPLCDKCLNALGQSVPFRPSSLTAAMRDMGNQAVRMLAVAVSDRPIDLSRPGALTLTGLVGIRDDVRKESQAAVEQITTAGVQTVMITGDNPQTAIAIAKEVGLLVSGEEQRMVYTGQQLARMSDFEIKRRLRDMRVVARAMPTDKSRLVRIAQEMGLVVGMTGDGINDAPALKKADVGFAMGSGTEVAKEAGDIVIIDNNILSIAKAILYGRNIFKSIRKFIVFQLTMNLSAVALSVICPFLGLDAPLTVMQMLWVNMIMDTLAGLAFAGEAPLAEYMREPPKKRDDSIINRYMYSQILFTGVYTSVLSLLFLTLPMTRELFRFGDGTHYFMTVFFALFIFAGVFNSLNARTPRVNLLSHISQNRLFICIMALICAVQVALIYNGGTVFRTMGIEPRHLQMITLVAFTVVPADMLRKLVFRVLGKKGNM